MISHNAKIPAQTGLRRFASRADLAAYLADAVATDIRADLERKGTALLAVSGGSTPALFFEALSEIELAWDRVTVTLVDERWVPETSERSNAGLVARTLLRNEAADASFLPLYDASPTPEEGAAHLRETFDCLAATGFSAVVLGMGSDGHTASFFPGADRLEEVLALDGEPLHYGMRAPATGEPRITFSLSALLNTPSLYLHCEGAEKSAVLQRAHEPGPVADIPVRAILCQQLVPVNIIWCH